MENQAVKNMEHEMATGIICFFFFFFVGMYATSEVPDSSFNYG